MASILVVASSVAMRQIVSLALTSAGHEVTEMSDAGLVLRLVERRRFDLVLADPSMPGMKGVDRLRGVPVCGVVKAFDAEVLREALRKACNCV
jgi:CheY-like chemotaxis protein